MNWNVQIRKEYKGNCSFLTIFGHFVPKMAKIESKRRLKGFLRRCDEIVDYSMDICRILPQQQAKKIKIQIFFLLPDVKI